MKIVIVLVMFFLFAPTGAYCQKKASDIFNDDNYKSFSVTQASSLKDSLNLTIEQEQQVVQIYSTLFEGLLRLRGDTTDFVARSAAIKKLTSQQDAAFEKILTKEQYQKYEAILSWRASIKHKK